jgi:hypothetical protein
VEDNAMARSTRFLVLFGVGLLALVTGIAVAQTETADSPDDEESTEEPATPGFVYTTDYLEKHFSDEPDEAQRTAITNESLGETAKPPEPAPSGAFTNETLGERARQPEPVPPTAFTNEDLTERFGPTEPGRQPSPEPPGTPPAMTEEAVGTEPGEPSLSAEERARRISETESELQRLEKRLLAIRNPLLAGSVPLSEEERAAEQGLDNAERLRRTQARIDELEAKLAELRSAGGR